MEHPLERVVGEDDRRSLAAALARSFPFADENTWNVWLERAGLDNLRRVRRDGAVLGGLCIHPIGQWFGGRCVPMGGVAAVGVVPEARGEGLALAMMRAALREMRERNLPLSALYPAAQALYRAAGYEHAGCRWTASIQAREIKLHHRSPEVHRVGIEEASSSPLWDLVAARGAGELARPEMLWEDLVRRSGEEVGVGYGVREDGELTGYAFLVQGERKPGTRDLVVTDMKASTMTAARRLLTLLADHRSLTGEVRWPSGPDDPFLTLLPEQRYTLRLGDHWMLRIVDVPEALAARGWPPGVHGEVTLAVRDDLFPENEGPWRLAVEEGEAEVCRTKKAPAGRIDVRGLAALYTGHLGGEALRIAGLFEADDEVLATATGLFRGPPPRMTDHF